MFRKRRRKNGKEIETIGSRSARYFGFTWKFINSEHVRKKIVFYLFLNDFLGHKEAQLFIKRKFSCSKNYDIFLEFSLFFVSFMRLE